VHGLYDPVLISITLINTQNNPEIQGIENEKPEIFKEVSGEFRYR
jgi:hypothetical protein